MKKLVYISATLLLIYSCKKTEKPDYDAMIRYKVYCNVAANGDTLYAFYIPTAFTPDGDGLNDVYFAKGTDIDPNNFEMSILSNASQNLFTTKNLNHGWDGHASGGNNIAPVGTYTYLFKLKDNTGDSHEYSGPITLLK